MNEGQRASRAALGAVFILLVLSTCLYLASAAPQGATVTGTPVVDVGPTRQPTGRNDTGGRIITLNLNLEQQNTAWKAYVGNVSGTFVLQNSNNRSIYEWPSISTATGEVYISRSNALTFTTIQCASATNMTVEQTVLGMLGTDSDSINNTFHSTGHRSFNVGSIPIANDTCPSVATWVNDTVQTANSTAIWQEVLLSDNTNLIYTSLLNDNKNGFDNVSLFDFQAIIAENRTSSSGSTYYFYLELSN